MARVGRNQFFSYFLSALVVAGVFCFHLGALHAATLTKQRANELQVGADATRRVTLFDGKFKGGATVAAGDVNGDGVDEFVVGAGSTGGSQVQIYRPDRTLIRSFFAFPQDMKDGINVAVGDLDGDGKAEIVVAPQPGHTPQVRVFNDHGQMIREFTVFESSYTGGIQVAVIPAHAGVAGNIIVASGFARQAEVRVYDAEGKKILASFTPFGQDSSNGATVTGGWSDTFGQSVVVIGPGLGQKPLIQIFSASTKEKLAQWLAYDVKVKTGLSITYRGDSVMTGPSVGGGPDVKTFSMHGDEVNRYSVYEPSFRGGVNVAGAIVDGVVTAIVVPTSAPTTAAGQGKSMVVSLSKQTITLFEHGRVISIRRVSTGKWSTPTPPGNYKIYNKISVAYSAPFHLYMENWMAFQPDGSMGLHGLPFWKLKNGGKLYEGASHIGTPVSHGCIRQTLADSKTLYEWAPIGTPLTVEG